MSIKGKNATLMVTLGTSFKVPNFKMKHKGNTTQRLGQIEKNIIITIPCKLNSCLKELTIFYFFFTHINKVLFPCVNISALSAYILYILFSVSMFLCIKDLSHTHNTISSTSPVKFYMTHFLF